MVKIQRNASVLTPTRSYCHSRTIDSLSATRIREAPKCLQCTVLLQYVPEIFLINRIPFAYKVCCRRNNKKMHLQHIQG